MNDVFDTYPEIKNAGFIEEEIESEILVNGPIAYVVSKYRKEYTYDGVKHVVEGTNNFHLVMINGQLQIISMSWFE